MTNVHALGPHPRVVLLVIAIIVFVIIVRLCRLRDWMLGRRLLYRRTPKIV